MELLRYLGISDKKGYHQWALLNHPDKGGDSAKFVEVKEAFERLHGRDGKSAPPAAASAAARAPEHTGADQWNQRFGNLFSKHKAEVHKTFFAERAPPPDAQRCTGWLASRGRRCFKLRARKGGDLCDVHAAKAANGGAVPKA